MFFSSRIQAQFYSEVKGDSIIKTDISKTDISKTEDININSRLYYWEDINKDFGYSPKKSIIKIIGDKFFRIDYPLDPGGMIHYSQGSITAIKGNSREIECLDNKSVTFSQNIGLVVWYQEMCNTSTVLMVNTDGTIVRTKWVDKGKLIKGKIKSIGSVEMYYKECKDADIPFDYSCLVQKLSTYQNADKLKSCDFFTNIKKGIRPVTTDER